MDGRGEIGAGVAPERRSETRAAELAGAGLQIARRLIEDAFDMRAHELLRRQILRAKPCHSVQNLARAIRQRVAGNSASTCCVVRSFWHSWLRILASPLFEGADIFLPHDWLFGARPRARRRPAGGRRCGAGPVAVSAARSAPSVRPRSWMQRDWMLTHRRERGHFRLALGLTLNEIEDGGAIIGKMCDRSIEKGQCHFPQSFRRRGSAASTAIGRPCAPAPPDYGAARLSVDRGLRAPMMPDAASPRAGPICEGFAGASLSMQRARLGPSIRPAFLPNFRPRSGSLPAEMRVALVGKRLKSASPPLRCSGTPMRRRSWNMFAVQLRRSAPPPSVGLDHGPSGLTGRRAPTRLRPQRPRCRGDDRRVPSVPSQFPVDGNLRDADAIARHIVEPPRLDWRSDAAELKVRFRPTAAPASGILVSGLRTRRRSGQGPVSRQAAPTPAPRAICGQPFDRFLDRFVN